MRTIHFAIILLGVSIASCASVDVPSQIERKVTPAVETIVTREVGESLFESTIARTYDGLSVPAGTKIGLGGILKYEIVEPLLSSGDGKYCGNLREAGHDDRACITEQTLLSQHISFTHERVTKLDSANYKQQLFYEGKVGNALHISYREFKNDLARPAFTQDFEFDLSDGDIIGARGARIHVILANNTEIKYEILKGFSE